MGHVTEQFGIGQPVRRKEDVRFLTGAGRYTDDVNLPGQVHMAILRSPHAHARIVSMDLSAARAAPGVLMVLTGPDAEADGLGHCPLMAEIPPLAGTPALFCPPKPILALGAVRFVGDAVAAVVAETRAQAIDALELIEIDYDALPAITDTARALDADAPVIWADRGSNLCVHWSNGRRPRPMPPSLPPTPPSLWSWCRTASSATRWSRASPSARGMRSRTATS